MAYPYTRATLRQRVLVESHTYSTSGAAATARVNALIQYAIGHTWETLTATDQAFAERTLEKVVSDADTDGWNPGVTAIVLPGDFRRVEEIKRGGGFPSRVTPSESMAWEPSSGVGWYYVRGPGQETDLAGDLVLASQELVVRPALRAGETWRLLYVQQPPSLGDPDNTAHDSIELDLVGDGIARIVVARAIVMMQARDDLAGQQRAAAEYGLARTEYENARQQRAGGINHWRRTRRRR